MDLIHEGRCASVTWERCDEEGWASLWITIEFKESIPYEFADFLYEYLWKNGVKSKSPKGSNYQEVSFIHVEREEDEDKLIGIDFGVANTECDYFEEYFEGEEFKEFMEKAIEEYESRGDV